MVAIKTKAREEAEPAQNSLARIASRQPAASPVQRPWGIADVQQGAGNLAMQHLLRSGALQAKLTVSQPGDMYEQEADRVAERVMSSALTPSMQRKCAMCTEGAPCPKCEEERIQTKEKPGRAPAVTPRVETLLTSMRGGGHPLPPSVRAFFEPRFGQDLGQVRVHNDGQGAESARALQARAFTIGPDIVFGTGEYTPESPAGRRLLAHELTH